LSWRSFASSFISALISSCPAFISSVCLANRRSHHRLQALFHLHCVANKIR
jgi:hypothetical protein